MATGYTQILNDNHDTTFQQFALRCARGMGALVMMRDDPMGAPIPDELPGCSSDYHENALAQAKEDLARYRAMTTDEAEVLSIQEYEEAVVRHSKHVGDNIALRARYKAMLSKVQAWEPPTHEHFGLQNFMISQLEESIKFDCSYEMPAPVQQSPEEWLEGKLSKALRDVEYHRKERDDDFARCKSRNEWVKALKVSLNI